MKTKILRDCPVLNAMERDVTILALKSMRCDGPFPDHETLPYFTAAFTRAAVRRALNITGPGGPSTRECAALRSVLEKLDRKAPIIDPKNVDDELTPEQLSTLRKRAGSARYQSTDFHATGTNSHATAREMIQRTTPLAWARALAKMKVGESIRFDAGNGEYDLISRVK